MNETEIPKYYYMITENLYLDLFWVIVFFVLIGLALHGAYIEDHSSNIHLENKKKLDQLLISNKKTDVKIDLILKKLM